MASNAKIGLLLGLVVIFVFAFIINGISGFGRARKNNDFSPIVDTDQPGIKPKIQQEEFTPIRIPDRHPEESSSPESKKFVKPVLPEITSPGENDLYTEPAKQIWPKVHVVRQGENLADIAKEYYGPKEGNRRANIKRIFEANSKLLNSPDEIYPGQRLIIPPLWASVPDKNGIGDIFPVSMFEEVESIGRRHL